MSRCRHGVDLAPANQGRTIEVLYFEGCPSYEALVSRLPTLVDRAGAKAEVRLLRVQSQDGARRSRFLGSPSVRVDGRDVEPGAESRRDYGLKCRLYHTPDGIVGTPPDSVIVDALEHPIHSAHEHG